MDSRFDKRFGRGTSREQGFYRMVGPGLDTRFSAPLKLDAKGIRFDETLENWGLFKQSAEAHAGRSRDLPSILYQDICAGVPYAN